MPPRLRQLLTDFPVIITAGCIIALAACFAVPFVERNWKVIEGIALPLALWAGKKFKPRCSEIAGRIVDDLFPKCPDEMDRPQSQQHAGDGQATHDSRNYEPTPLVITHFFRPYPAATANWTSLSDFQNELHARFAAMKGLASTVDVYSWGQIDRDDEPPAAGAVPENPKPPTPPLNYTAADLAKAHREAEKKKTKGRRKKRK